MLRVGCRKRLMARSCGVVVALTLVPGVASAQTLTDPVGDNCRNYPGLPGSPDITGCGPDISQAVFQPVPGDGNLHVNVSYASLPSGPLIPQLPTYIELGIYPKTATTPQLVVGSHRFSNFGGTWKLQLLSSTAFQVLADGSATTSALGIELVVPLGPLGAPSNISMPSTLAATVRSSPSIPTLLRTPVSSASLPRPAGAAVVVAQHCSRRRSRSSLASPSGRPAPRSPEE